MSKKKLETDTIRNELEGASAFFRQKSPAPESSGSGEALSEAKSVGKSANFRGPNEGTFERPSVRTAKPKHHRSNERTKVRHTFDIFADQLTALRRIRLDREEISGKRYLLGDLVQEALDMLIAKERTIERSNDRTPYATGE